MKRQSFHKFFQFRRLMAHRFTVRKPWALLAVVSFIATLLLTTAQVTAQAHISVTPGSISGSTSGSTLASVTNLEASVSEDFLPLVTPSSIPVGQGDDASMQQAITQGIAAYHSGQFARAIAHWQSAIAQSKNTSLIQAYLLSNLANAYQQIGQAQAAQEALTQSLAIIETWPQTDPAYWEVSARVLNTQGQSQWQQGKNQQALITWQQAEQHYQKAHNASGQVIAQINQAQALQELGFNAQAAQELDLIKSQIPTFPLELQLAATKELGKALRRVGNLSEALKVLTEDLPNFAALEHPSEQSLQLKLELGHTARALSHREIAVGKRKLANAYAEQAIAAYTAATEPTAAAIADLPFLKTQAQLNQLSYLIETGRLESARAFWPSIAPLTSLPLGRASVEAYISYAHSLACLNAPLTAACIKQEWQEYIHKEPLSNEQLSGQPWELMISLLTTAINQAETLQDPLLKSYAMGELGHAYELTRQWPEAIQLTQRALILLEGMAVPDVAYRWEWQLGRLYATQSSVQDVDVSRDLQAIRPERDFAINAYKQALTSLNAVRQNLLLVDPQVQFSFRDNVEPIYREFVSLLLGNSLNSNDESANQPDQDSLHLAVDTLDALQLTELENFLGCNLSQLVNLNESGIDPKAIKIYPIILPERLAIIFNIPERPLVLRSVAVTQTEVERTLSELRNHLTSPGKTPDVLTTASQVYQWLITPLEPILAENPQIETLVFVPDGPLRNIPMGVLYDGEQYLIEKERAIAIAPQLDLFAPRPAPKPLKVLRGGIGLPQIIRGQSFPSIERVQAELDEIPDSLTVGSPLLNEGFTLENIKQQLATQRYSAIHWKTHGVFSSIPAETFLVAYQDAITANDLSDLVQSASARQAEPLELLVLSACESAQGDRRAVLGLSGIAVRAGTRSALSTLWRADDGANTQLMATFYEGLANGLSKAKALQKAQQGLLTESGYPAPYYWASYILVGNWL